MAMDKLGFSSNPNAAAAGRNRFHWAEVALAMAALIAWGTGPEGIGPEPAWAEQVIRPDGVVEILKPDGSAAATLAVEIAETPEARARGLMGRVLSDYLAGMLFIFASAEPQTFWMRNTPSSLDMIFIDAGGTVLNTAAYTTPMSDQLYSSAGPAKYVVEAKAGFADRFGIRPGYTMRWKRLR
ncbi:MAG: DUF192 domain-containing protein [Hyphomicrobiales bacterium]